MDQLYRRKPTITNHITALQTRASADEFLIANNTSAIQATNTALAAMYPTSAFDMNPSDTLDKSGDGDFDQYLNIIVGGANFAAGWYHSTLSYVVTGFPDNKGLNTVHVTIQFDNGSSYDFGGTLCFINSQSRLIMSGLIHLTIACQNPTIHLYFYGYGGHMTVAQPTNGGHAWTMVKVAI
jgi:hypothetical protein